MLIKITHNFLWLPKPCKFMKCLLHPSQTNLASKHDDFDRHILSSSSRGSSFFVCFLIDGTKRWRLHLGLKRVVCRFAIVEVVVDGTQCEHFLLFWNVVCQRADDKWHHALQRTQESCCSATCLPKELVQMHRTCITTSNVTPLA